MDCRTTPKWNWLIILVSAMMWQVLKMKHALWLEMAAIWKCWNLHGKTCETTLVELIFGWFYPFETTVPPPLWPTLCQQTIEDQCCCCFHCCWSKCFLCCPCPCVESPLRTQFTRIKIQTKLLENFSRKEVHKTILDTILQVVSFFSNEEFSFIL